MGAVGTGYSTEFALPDVESRRGFDILDEHFADSSAGGEGGTIAFRAEQGVADPEVERAMTAFLAEVDQIEQITVTSPYSAEGAQQISSVGPEAGRIAYAVIGAPRGMTLEEATAAAQEMKALIPQVDGLQVEIGGQIFAEFAVPSSEALGLAFAIIVLIVAFGSVLAMGLPVGIALAGIGVGSVLVGLFSNVLSIPEFSTTVAVMLGLGVGIDYALFIVTRFREHVHRGASFEEATTVAIDTAGRAVAFAGSTVVISLMGMLLMNLAFVSGMAIAAATVVAVTAVASLTLLPALLGFAAHRVEVTRWRGLIAAGLVAVGLAGFALDLVPLMLAGFVGAAVAVLVGFAFAPLRQEVPHRAPRPLRETISYRWSRYIQRRPWSSVLAAVAILAVLAVPFFSLRLAFSDEGNYPEDTTTRQAYDLLAAGFGPGFNGPLLLATEVPAGTDPAALEAVTTAMAADVGVAFVTPAVPNDPAAPTAALWRLFPATAPQDEATTDLVNRLRDEVLPPATTSSGLDIVVSGSVAAGVDFSEYLTARLPAFIAVVLGLSFLLLMLAFRSVLVPLKAVVMNLLSIGAAYGVVTAIFQWGWLGGLIGVEPAPIEPFVPMMMFAIVFGLSMDYEVFLLSRVREEYLRTGDSRVSVADGLAATARVITAAAAIMVVVFGSFIGEPDRLIKLFGVGLASAVLLDATVVRLLLVPATMELLGDRNWWLPGWLDRIIPNIDVEGHSLEPDVVAAEPEPVST
ncbi:MAG: MMPL family transporter [Acidimicrobiia bacterium]|nr:MMPL family transporter [Acidimicrobiia bacterium]